MDVNSDAWQGKPVASVGAKEDKSRKRIEFFHSTGRLARVVNEHMVQ